MPQQLIFLPISFRKNITQKCRINEWRFTYIRSWFLESAHVVFHSVTLALVQVSLHTLLVESDQLLLLGLTLLFQSLVGLLEPAMIE